GALWRSWGIEPDVVVGHSMGEVSAAHLAGVLDLEDAILVLHHRGRVLRENQRSAAIAGGMLVVTHPESAEREALAECAEASRDLSIAVTNSPGSVVLSGTLAAVERAEARLALRKVQTDRVNVAFASHCALMDPVCGPF